MNFDARQMASQSGTSSHKTMGGKGAYKNADSAELDQNGQVLYGMDKELAAKAAAKFDPVMEADARNWIEAVTGAKLGEMPLQEELKDGTVLCTLVNTISPAVIKAPSTSKMPFKQMENISNYLDACSKLGVPKHDLFQTVALFENKDMIAVLTNIHSLGRVSQKVAGFAGPYLGAKLADANAREFTQEQLDAGKGAATFLGKGSHGCANQSGMVDSSKNIVKSHTAVSSTPGKMMMGSAGLASQAGMHDTSRNIVKPNASDPPAAAPTAPAQPMDRAKYAELAGCAGAVPSSPGAKGTYTTYDESKGANYGMDQDLAAKAEAKMAEVGGGMEAEARGWIEAVTGTALGGMSLQEELKDGTVLCTLANKISDGCCKAPSSSKMPFKQMENIAAYLEACTALGVPQNDLFQTVALFENKDMIAVLTNIHSLGRVSQKVEGFAGPYLGAKLASTNRRSFTEEQLAAGLNAATFLGKGSHGCASQQGTFDTNKEIVKGNHAGLEGLGASDATFMGTGSHGCANSTETHLRRQIT
jgi:hypothetical protein